MQKRFICQLNVLSSFFSLQQSSNINHYQNSNWVESKTKTNNWAESLNSKGPNWRKSKSVNQISVFKIWKESEKVSKKLKTSEDSILIFTEYKNGKNVEKIQKDLDCRRVVQN